MSDAAGSVLEFRSVWLPSEGMLDPAEAATNAELGICVGGVDVTECADASASVRTTVVIPTIVLAEWFVEAWTDLLADERRPIATDDDADVLELDVQVTEAREKAVLDRTPSPRLELWSRHHCMRYARHGFPLPDIVFLREQDEMAIGWRPSTGGRLRFIAPVGVGRVSLRAAVRAMSSLVSKTLGRLRTLKINSQRAKALERAWSNLDTTPALRNAVAARAGRTWAWLEQTFGKEGKRLLAALDVPEDLRPVEAWQADSTVLGLLRSSDPRLTPEDVEALRAVTAEAKKRGVSTVLKSSRAALSKTSATTPVDFRRGYERARALRALWGVGLDVPLLDLEKRIESLLEGPTLESALSDRKVDALCAWDPEGGAVVAVNPRATMGRTRVGRRMAIAHELCHLLFHAHAGQPLAVASGPWAIPSLEREGNAFAAELLLPLEAARAALNGRGVTLEVAAEIGKSFDVGVETTLWQLANRVQAISAGDARALLRLAAEPRTFDGN